MLVMFINIFLERDVVKSDKWRKIFTEIEDIRGHNC